MVKTLSNRASASFDALLSRHREIHLDLNMRVPHFDQIPRRAHRNQVAHALCVNPRSHRVY